jgi:hypothetical protein
LRERTADTALASVRERLVPSVRVRRHPIAIAMGVCAAAAVAVVVCSTATSAHACSCVPPQPPLEAAARASAVFEGRSFAAVREGNLVRYEFEVLRVWKGETPARVTITSAVSSSACGRAFETGVPYVVYASGDARGQLSDNLCSRTRQSTRASEDVDVLGAGHSPLRTDEAPRGEAPMVEPPRIEPAAAALGPGKRGCRTAGEDPSLALLGLLALVRMISARHGCATKGQ